MVGEARSRVFRIVALTARALSRSLPSRSCEIEHNAAADFIGILNLFSWMRDSGAPYS